MSYHALSSGSSSLKVSSISRKPLPPAYAPVPQPDQNLASKVGSSQEKIDGIGAKWAIGWKTPVTMIACYILALLFSITHLSMFMFLDNKPVSGYRQSYVTTASNILASSFRLSVEAALSIAFTQKLWNILRKSARSTHTIEQLFRMRDNPFSTFHLATIQTAPFLVIVVVVLWGLHIASTFPPGALTIIRRPYETNIITEVMALKTSLIEGPDIASTFNITIAELLFVGFIDNDTAIMKQAVVDYTSLHGGAVLQSATRAMISNSITTLASPCGLNCTYILRFPGPYLLCDEPLLEISIENNPIRGFYEATPMYFGVWNKHNSPVTIPANLSSSAAFSAKVANSTSAAVFNATIVRPIGIENTTEALLVTETTFLECRPGQATYDVNVIYLNEVQTFEVSIDQTSIRPLLDVSQGTILAICSPGCICCGELGCDCSGIAIGIDDVYGEITVLWSRDNLQWLSDSNNMAIIESMTLALSGEYSVYYDYSPDPSPSLNFTLPNGTVFLVSPVTTADFGPQNGTIIASTGLNLLENAYNSSGGLNLIITQDSLNELLQNITLSLMNNLGTWTTEVNATQSALRNVYSFSDKANLFLPYYISLLIVLPLLAIGGFSLFEDGVSATDGGFLQILTTTSTSRRLHAIAAEGALGGEENVPHELKELEIMFGELVGENGERCVGFGMKDEVVRMEKGARYRGLVMHAGEAKGSQVFTSGSERSAA